jgi:hypothetical protein
MSYILTIVTPTVPSRAGVHSKLLAYLQEKIKEHCLEKKVQLLYLGDNFSMSVGEKRNWLYNMAKGIFVSSLDDDDYIDGDKLSVICEAAEKYNPDVITFNGKYIANSVHRGDFNISLAHKKNEDLMGRNGVTQMNRIPNHICFIKNEIIKQHAYFTDKNLGEDQDFSNIIRPHLKKELHLDFDYYFYDYNSSTTLTQK